jgi:hypothetical protein
MATTKIIPEVLDLNEAASDSGLKIPTGTNNNRPATDVAGMIRNNTNESSDSSASCEEYYNGTAWKKINNVPLPVYFRTVLYTGNGGTQSITGVGFEPDVVWIKDRIDGTYKHQIYDSTRGATKKIFPNTTNAESTDTTGLQSFDTGGFTVGTNVGLNTNGNDYVAWCWKANGGTTSSNTDGTLTSTVQANTGLGFSIVKYTGVVNGSAKSFGHGLGVVPDMVIIKDIDWAVPSWFVWHKDLAGDDYFLRLENTSAQAQSSGIYSSAPTSSVVNIGNDSGVGDRTDNYIAYCFNSVAGYSKFGTYAGSASNVDVVTGFQPSFVLVRSTGVEDWNIMDSARGGSERLFPNTDGAESTTANACIFNSDGFTIGVTGNASLNNAGDNYIYMAFK